LHCEASAVNYFSFGDVYKRNELEVCLPMHSYSSVTLGGQHSDLTRSAWSGVHVFDFQISADPDGRRQRL
jgi:hypothetical protein